MSYRIIEKGHCSLAVAMGGAESVPETYGTIRLALEVARDRAGLCTTEVVHVETGKVSFVGGRLDILTYFEGRVPRSMKGQWTEIPKEDGK